MGANFTPTFDGYAEQQPFRYWCQTVLPLVYDDSLSYYELLNKVVAYLNNVITDVSTVESNVDALLNAYQQLQNYVNDYFENLDVQGEINNKLDEMATDGTLSQLISPYVSNLIGGVVAEQIGGTVANQIGDTVANQIDDVVAEQIGEPAATAATAWLNENVNPVGSAVVVDATLTISGAAADSKTVGDKFRNKALCINTLDSDITDLNDLDAQGIYYLGSGTNLSNMPVVSPCMLINYCDVNNPDTRHYQVIYYYLTASTYFRNKRLNTWSEWNQVCLKNYTDTLFNSITFKPTALTADDDLNTITNVVPYFVSTALDTPGLPLEREGGLLLNFCYPGQETTRAYQIFIPYLKHGRAFIRNKVAGTYTQWYEFNSTTKNTIQKNSDTQYQINFGNYNIKLVRIDDDNTNSHLWNLIDIRTSDYHVVVPSGTDIIGPIRETGQDDFMGGVHGDETNTLFAIYLDGVVYDMSSTKEFKKMDIIMESNLQRVSTHDNIALRKVHISITENKIEIQNQIKALETFTVARACNGGLIAARNDIINGIAMNNYIVNQPPTTTPTEISSKTNTNATIFTSYGTINIENIIGHEQENYRGKLTVFTNETPMRSKIYFDIIDTNTQLVLGDTVTGAFVYRFNK